MRYIDVQWKKNFKNEPVRFVSEIDDDEFEARKLEFFRDGSVGFACNTVESQNTRVGIDIVPTIDEINSQEEFEGISISKNNLSCYGKSMCQVALNKFVLRDILVDA